MLSDIFDEPVDKGNLESVVERQLNLKINLGDRTTNFGNSNTINYINACSEVPTTSTDKSQPPNPESQGNNNQVKIEAVGKLRQLGLSDEQIAEVLGLALEVVKQMD